MHVLHAHAHGHGHVHGQYDDPVGARRPARTTYRMATGALRSRAAHADVGEKNEHARDRKPVRDQLGPLDARHRARGVAVGVVLCARARTHGHDRGGVAWQERDADGARRAVHSWRAGWRARVACTGGVHGCRLGEARTRSRYPANQNPGVASRTPRSVIMWKAGAMAGSRRSNQSCGGGGALGIGQ